MMEEVGCPLGCSPSDEAVLTGRDLLHDLPGKFNVVKCSTCGLMRTNPRPTPRSIGKYYPDDYGPYLATQTPQSKSPARKLLGPLIKRLVKFNIQSVPSMPPGRMLEVGCAVGEFLRTMAGRGWEVEGIEFSEKAARAAANLGFRVHAGPLETAPVPKEPFDLVVGWMVLEHLHDPLGGLKKLREWSKPGAWLAMSVPNAGALEFRFFRDKWYALQLPTHLTHFTPDSITKLMAASGWQVTQIQHQRVLSNLISSLGYSLRDKGLEKLGRRLIEFPEKSGQMALALHPLAVLLSSFGQTGRMTVWARASPSA
jgi:2-polyprenyl-3-methyl-5-hydroxy-6-metoxy-1,4-benzoquinol methylase